MIKNFLKKVLSGIGYSIKKIDTGPPNPQSVNQIKPRYFFDTFFSNVPKEDFLFVQIGANDGKSGDFLHRYIEKYSLTGILVEPQVEVFEKLKKLHDGNEKLRFANIAIARNGEDLPFYRVKEALHTKENYFEVTAISSFDKKTFTKTVMKRVPHKIKYVSDNIDDYADEINVRTLSFDAFVKEYEIDHIDYLQIDCEGYDYEIIQMIDFNDFRPRVIRFESKWFSDKDRDDCEKLLIAQGYTIFRFDNDTCAFK